MGYWDLEEGKDCVGKTWVTTKVGTVAGLVTTVYRMIIFKPEPPLQALTTAASLTGTMAAMGAVFGITTCLTAHVRDEPDSLLNYFVGGCASGALLGARTHSPMTGTMGCLGLGTVAMFTKAGKMEGWRLTGPPRM